MSTEVMRAPGLFRASVRVWGAHAAAGFQDAAAGRVSGVRVQQLNQGRGLVLQAGVFPGIVSVNVCVAHVFGV